eukprot:2937604-Pleurochrysis_carterae.AAC.2
MQHLDRAREREAVHPHVLGDPVVRPRPLRLGIKRATALEQARYIVLRQPVGDALNLHREHQHPDLLVPFKQAALHVAGHVEGEVVDDVDDALGRERRLVALRDGHVEELEELLQRHHVHVGDGRHVHHQEVEQRAARRHRAEEKNDDNAETRTGAREER